MKTAPIVGLPPAAFTSLAGFARPDAGALATVAPRPSYGAAASGQPPGQGTPFTAPATRLTLSAEAQQRAGREALLRDVIDRNLTLDPDLREVVYQAVDTRSGEIVFQVPNESALKMRIYTRTVAAEPTIRAVDTQPVITREA